MVLLPYQIVLIVVGVLIFVGGGVACGLIFSGVVSLPVATSFEVTAIQNELGQTMNQDFTTQFNQVDASKFDFSGVLEGNVATVWQSAAGTNFIVLANTPSGWKMFGVLSAADEYFIILTADEGVGPASSPLTFDGKWTGKDGILQATMSTVPLV